MHRRVSEECLTVSSLLFFSNRLGSSWRSLGFLPNPDMPMAASMSISAMALLQFRESVGGGLYEGLPSAALAAASIGLGAWPLTCVSTRFTETRYKPASFGALSSSRANIQSSVVGNYSHLQHSLFTYFAPFCSMLKRQRSVPSFVPDPYPPTDPAIEMFEERVAKRRRHAQSTDKGKTPWLPGESDGEEDAEYSEQATGRSAPSEQARRLGQAGEYKHVNTLLHDLHAEQRHRMLFSSSSPPIHQPFAHYHPRHLPELAYPSSSLDKLAATVPVHGPPAADPTELHRHMPSFTISIPIKDASTVDHVEVQRVTERYEESNRCVNCGTFSFNLTSDYGPHRLLGSLFLNRRRQCHDQET